VDTDKKKQCQLTLANIFMIAKIASQDLNQTKATVVCIAVTEQ
jgi:hypothetical protein